MTTTKANADPAFRTLEDMRDAAGVLEGLVVAMGGLSDRLGPEGGPIFSCIVSARPLAERIARGLDSYITREGAQ